MLDIECLTPPVLMEKKNEYTIWLMPAGQLYDELAQIISRLSGEYTAPLFKPHITLLGNIADTEEKIISKTAELAGLLKPFPIFFTALDSLDEYFRCLFIRAKETEGLMQANAKARMIFNRQQDPPFMPHLSLLYGEFPSEIKEQIIAKIGKEFSRTLEVNSLYVAFSSKNIDPKDWRVLKEFPF